MGNLAYSGNAYGAATRATGTPRTVEYQVFSQVTGRLTRAMRPGARFAELAAALVENRELWTVVMIDVASPENGLPPKLRAQLFYLGEFTAAHTRKVLKREADAQALVDINKMIMRGLRGENEQKADEPCRA